MVGPSRRPAVIYKLSVTSERSTVFHGNNEFDTCLIQQRTCLYNLHFTKLYLSPTFISKKLAFNGLLFFFTLSKLHFP